MARRSSSRRPLHHSLMAILFPPLAHWHHRRYHKKPHHLAIDSGLNVVMLGLALWIGIGLWLATQNAGLGVMVTIPAIRNGETTTITLTINNREPKAIEYVVVKPVLPPTWSLASQATELEVGSIPGHGQRILTLSVTPRGQAKQLQELKFIFQGQRGILPVAQRLSTAVRLQSIPLVVKTSTAKGKIGQPISVHLQLRSTSEVPLDNVVIQPQAVRGLTIVSGGQNFQAGKWTLNHIAAASTQDLTLILQPGIVGTVQLPIKVGLIHNGRFILDHTERTTISIASAGSSADVLQTPSQVSANISTEAIYYSTVGFQFGYGPLPLQVGQATTLRIFWLIRPSSDTATSATVTATLPAGVTWKGNGAVTGGTAVTFDAGQRRVRWAIGSWNAQQDVLTGSFDVSITPTKAQIGSYPTLVQGTRLSYLDGLGRLQVVPGASATTRTADPNSSTAGRVNK